MDDKNSCRHMIAGKYAKYDTKGFRECSLETRPIGMSKKPTNAEHATEKKIVENILPNKKKCADLKISAKRTSFDILRLLVLFWWKESKSSYRRVPKW